MRREDATNGKNKIKFSHVIKVLYLCAVEIESNQNKIYTKRVQINKIKIR